MLYCSCMLGRTHCLNWVPQSFSSIKEVKHPFFARALLMSIWALLNTLERICFCRAGASNQPQFDKDQKSWSIFSMVANIKLLLSIVNLEQTKAEFQVGSSKGDNCKNLIKAHSLVFYFVVFYVNSEFDSRTSRIIFLVLNFF